MQFLAHKSLNSEFLESSLLNELTHRRILLIKKKMKIFLTIQNNTITLNSINRI